jgi:aldehyde:ferredoxin oxidoreductase
MKTLGAVIEEGRSDRQANGSFRHAGVLACVRGRRLPVRNFRKLHPDAWKVDGERPNAARIATYGCPNCIMRCGITIHDHEGRESELDYENIGLLGPNLEIFDLDQVGSLNYLCDDYGIDTMSAGCVLSFYADAIDRGATTGDFKFGDAERAKELLGIAAARLVGNLLADGSLGWPGLVTARGLCYAGQGIEFAAYNCKFILAWPGLRDESHRRPPKKPGHHRAKTPSANPMGARRRRRSSNCKDPRLEYLVSCRFPWIELGWELKNYPIYFNTATGLNWTLDDFWKVSDRIYALMKFFWAREIPDWDRTRDYPPMVWFDPANADKEGLSPESSWNSMSQRASTTSHPGLDKRDTYQEDGESAWTRSEESRNIQSSSRMKITTAYLDLHLRGRP